MSKFKLTAAVAIVVALTVIGNGAKADFITNGNFESTTNGGGQLGFNTNATGWTNGFASNGKIGYNFLFTPGSADTTGVIGSSGANGGVLKLWGPGDGSNNGMPATSPDGGNYLALDGAFNVGTLSQTISGLTAGAQYTVSFLWAGAQQTGFSGATTDQLLVSLGSQQLATNVLSLSSKGFSGWQQTSFTFTADSSSDVLSFLAVGTPAGVPPFALLDGVTMTQAPEPASLSLMGAGLAAMGFVRRRKQRKA